MVEIDWKKIKTLFYEEAALHPALAVAIQRGLENSGSGCKLIRADEGGVPYREGGKMKTLRILGAELFADGKPARAFSNTTDTVFRRADGLGVVMDIDKGHGEVPEEVFLKVPWAVVPIDGETSRPEWGLLVLMDSETSCAQSEEIALDTIEAAFPELENPYAERIAKDEFFEKLVMMIYRKFGTERQTAERALRFWMTKAPHLPCVDWTITGDLEKGEPVIKMVEVVPHQHRAVVVVRRSETREIEIELAFPGDWDEERIHKEAKETALEEAAELLNGTAGRKVKTRYHADVKKIEKVPT